MYKWKILTAAFLGLLIASSSLPAKPPVFKSSEKGNPKVQSIQAIGFGPGGVLLIGDGVGCQIVAIDTGDHTTAGKWSKKKRAGFHEYLAGKLGATAKQIEISNIAANRVSGKVYVVVRDLRNKKDLILTVVGQGKVGEFPLENVRYVRVNLTTNTKSKFLRITDLAWANGRVLVAAQARETFASKIYSVPAPLINDGMGKVFSTKTYHVAHRRWETNAPIRTMIPYQEDGKNYVVGAFTCTPVVKFSIDDLKPKAKVEGQSLIELGSGNRPRDMFVYEKGGKKFILMNAWRSPRHYKRLPIGPSPYWTVRIDYELLQENQKINELALRRLDNKQKPATKIAQVMPNYHGVVHLDQLNNSEAVVVRTDDKGGMSLEVLPLP